MLWLGTRGVHVLSEVTLTLTLGPTQEETMAEDTLGAMTVVTRAPFLVQASQGEALSGNTWGSCVLWDFFPLASTWGDGTVVLGYLKSIWGKCVKEWDKPSYSLSHVLRKKLCCVFTFIGNISVGLNFIKVSLVEALAAHCHSILKYMLWREIPGHWKEKHWYTNSG